MAYKALRDLSSCHLLSGLISHSALAHFAPATLAFVPFHEHVKHIPNSGALHLLFLLPDNSFLLIPICLAPPLLQMSAQMSRSERSSLIYAIYQKRSTLTPPHPNPGSPYSPYPAFSPLYFYHLPYDKCIYLSVCFLLTRM